MKRHPRSVLPPTPTPSSILLSNLTSAVHACSQSPPSIVRVCSLVLCHPSLHAKMFSR
jgi:hypothetical protein